MPQRREETKSVVRESSRPVRVLVDQQASVIRQLAESSRAVDDLDNELRRLRAATGSREARYAALAAAVRDEMRLYEAEVAAAADRLGQQRLPGGGARFAREQFVAQVCHRHQFIRQHIHIIRKISVNGRSPEKHKSSTSWRPILMKPKKM